MLAGPLSAGAQEARKVARIGILCGVRCEGPSYDTLREGLRELGWIEGQSLVVDVRGAEGKRERLPALAADLVSLKVDLIVAVAPEPNRAAKNATSTIPIVMIGVADCCGLIKVDTEISVVRWRRGGVD
jgi:putative ABC transport system substrate-binding protein